ncbi:MAG: ECF-type sigma factor [Gemmatimonadota bacterium]|nr:ECF-type sigma factor [Gemmatimonadota bacterium]
MGQEERPPSRDPVEPGERTEESSHSEDGEIRRLLEAARQGDREAVSRLVPLLYHELHELARSQRARWRGHVSLNTTGLLHEAYMKVAGQPSPDWRDRSHFMAVACTAMRQVLIDRARRRQAQKRGGGVRDVTFDDLEKLLGSSDPRPDTRDDALLILDECLDRLAERSRRQARVVECRFFGGMTIPETAEALDISPATVKRDWALAQAWLYREMRGAVEA